MNDESEKETMWFLWLPPLRSVRLCGFDASHPKIGWAEEIWLVSRIFASAWSVPCSNPSPENSFIRR